MDNRFAFHHWGSVWELHLSRWNRYVKHFCGLIMDGEVAQGMDDRYMAFIGSRPAAHPKFENMDVEWNWRALHRLHCSPACRQKIGIIVLSFVLILGHLCGFQPRNLCRQMPSTVHEQSTVLCLLVAIHIHKNYP